MAVAELMLAREKGIGCAGVVYTTLAILVEISDGAMASANEKAPGIPGLSR
jgi:hypothetical protein